MSIIIGFFLLTAIIFLYFSYKWESSVNRPSQGKIPLVSILIPAYNSEKTIGKCIKSALNLDYPKKEILVVNDSKDKTPKIAKRLGVKCIQNKKRLGKAVALNEAVKKVNGSILYFLDADTVTRKDALKKMVPWFRDKEIAVVSPKFIAHNPHKLLTKTIAIENAFTSSLYKIHMYFGSLIAFRGCGVVIKKSVFEKLGGWPRTQIEDNDFAALVVTKGYKIQYEPEAVVETREAETVSELSRQRKRWGKGAFYTFWNHKRGYKSNKQFLVSSVFYGLLALSILTFMVLQSYLYVLPLLFLFATYSYSQFVAVFLLMIIPLLANVVVIIGAGAIGHFTLLTFNENKQQRTRDSLFIIPYIFMYIPMILYFYTRGILSAISDKIDKEDELDFQYW